MRPAVEIVARACRPGMDIDTLRPRILAAIGKHVPYEAAFLGIVDPATMLFTRTYADAISLETMAQLGQNEFMGDDPNKFTQVADGRPPPSLLAATEGDLGSAERYREIFRPLGWGDEIRACFRDSSGVWGLLCMHRAEGDVPFSEDDARFLEAISPHIAAAIRTSVLIGAVVAEGPMPDMPGLVLLSSDLEVIGTNDPGEAWLQILRPSPDGVAIPHEILHLAAAAHGLSSRGIPAAAPRVRVQTATGGWAVMHSSVMTVGDQQQVAVIIEHATPTELAPLIVAAYGLTNQERRIVELVCQGSSTREISAELVISAHTVQDHLKSIFAKTGTGSRRELVATLLARDYRPAANAGRPLNAKGQFTA